MLKYKNIKKKVLSTRSPQLVFKTNVLSVALCAIAKNENLYIREWVEYYKQLGIAHIFLYDNNDIDGERFEDVIQDYIDDGFVEVINKRGVLITIKSDRDGNTLLGLCYIDCYNKCSDIFDYICFFDIDEFLNIGSYKSLYDFIKIYLNFDGINVLWRMYGDNNLIFHMPGTLFERFNTKQNESFDCRTKTIMKTKLLNIKFCAHGPLNIKNLNFVNTKFEKTLNVYRNKNAYTDLNVYLDHYYSKSTEEFFKRKYMQPSAVTGINPNRNFNKLFLFELYFKYNKITDEKLAWIDNYESLFVNNISSDTPETTFTENEIVDVYIASLYRDGNIIKTILSLINQKEVKSITVSCNNYTNALMSLVKDSFNSSKLILLKTNNEKMSFEKLRFVNLGCAPYVAFCDDDLIFPSFYFRKMIYECNRLNSPISYHGAILKKLPIDNYYKDRIMYSFTMNVSGKKEVDIIGNGVSLMKREYLSKEEWQDLYFNAPKISMDDITISHMLRKKGFKLYVIKHERGEIQERANNKKIDTVYNTYKNNCIIQTNYVNLKFTKFDKL